MRVLKIIFWLGIVSVLAKGVFDLGKKNYFLNQRLQRLQTQLEEIETENRQLKDRIVYFSHLENLIKEVKSKFNYLKPGEKLIVLPEQD